MEGRRADTEDALVEQMLQAAVLAAAYEAVIRQDPVLRAGFGRLVEKHKATAARLYCDLCARRGWRPAEPQA